MSPDVARRVITLFRDVRPPDKADYELTPHEVRLLKLMVEGHSYKSAATILHVTPHTVSFHLRRIYEKHGLDRSSARKAVEQARATYLRQCLYRSRFDRWIKERLGYDPRRGWRQSYE